MEMRMGMGMGNGFGMGITKALRQPMLSVIQGVTEIIYRIRNARSSI